MFKLTINNVSTDETMEYIPFNIFDINLIWEKVREGVHCSSVSVGVLNRKKDHNGSKTQIHTLQLEAVY